MNLIPEEVIERLKKASDIRAEMAFVFGFRCAEMGINLEEATKKFKEASQKSWEKGDSAQ